MVFKSNVYVFGCLLGFVWGGLGFCIWLCFWRIFMVVSFSWIGDFSAMVYISSLCSFVGITVFVMRVL